MSARRPLDTIPPTPPIKLSHVVLRSRDVAVAKKWWMTVLCARDIMEGMPGSEEGFGAAGLTYDNEHHRVLIIPMDPGSVADLKDDPVFTLTDKAQKTPGMQHIAFTQQGIAELLATYKRLSNEQILPTFCVNHGGTLSMYYTDPDGNAVEMMADTMPMDVATEFMHSDAFQENTIGYPWDPAEFCERYEAGESLMSLASDSWNALPLQ